MHQFVRFAHWDAPYVAPIMQALCKGGKEVDIDKLFSAIKDNDIEAVTKLIRDIPSSEFNSRTSDSEKTALMLACEVSSPEIIKLLLDSGAEAAWEMKWSSETTLKSLARGIHCDLEILELIISDYGEDCMPYEINNNGDEYGEKGDPEIEEESPLDIVKRLDKKQFIEKFKELNAT